MAYIENTPHPKSGKYRAGYTDWRGKQKKFTGTTNPKETLRLARKLEDEHREMRLTGKAPRSWEQAKGRDVAEVMAEYSAWGNAQGGRGGRPWSAKHSQKRAYFLRFWQERLGNFWGRHT